MAYRFNFGKFNSYIYKPLQRWEILEKTENQILSKEFYNPYNI